MSVIEFSGLVTGLDTNSWVSALTALKNAKVEELQTERAAVVDLKDVVSGIKSFFTSFRSSLEKLTDAKFGVDAMDIFVQNLANSSDPSKVTATASYTASRDTYEVGVTQLASRIEGLTVNIKGLTEGEYVTIRVERDTQSIIDAVQETLDAYNTLVAELNTVLAIGGDLHSDTALKSLKNQITSMFTSRGTNGVTQFRNLAAIGISTESASSAMPSDIYSLYLDADKFENALNTSEDEVKLLLVGTEDNPGILTRVETIVENMLATTGYFSTKTKSLDREISQYDAKIEKAQAQADSYKAMLENKFQNMELLYSQMQSAYTNVFSGGLV